MMEKFDSIYADSINDDIEFDVIFSGEEDGSLIESVDPEYFYNESGEEIDSEEDDTETEDIEEKCKKEAVENISSMSDLESFIREMDEEEEGDPGDTEGEEEPTDEGCKKESCKKEAVNNISSMSDLESFIREMDEEDYEDDDNRDFYDEDEDPDYGHKDDNPHDGIHSHKHCHGDFCHTHPHDHDDDHVDHHWHGDRDHHEKDREDLLDNDDYNDEEHSHLHGHGDDEHEHPHTHKYDHYDHHHHEPGDGHHPGDGYFSDDLYYDKEKYHDHNDGDCKHCEPKTIGDLDKELYTYGQPTDNYDKQAIHAGQLRDAKTIGDIDAYTDREPVSEYDDSALIDKVERDDGGPDEEATPDDFPRPEEQPDNSFEVDQKLKEASTMEELDSAIGLVPTGQNTLGVNIGLDSEESECPEGIDALNDGEDIDVVMDESFLFF